MNKIPFISLSQSLILLRFCIPMLFVSHAIVRIANGTILTFSDFLSNKGFGHLAIFVVWGITIFEIIGGITLAFGYFVKWISVVFIIMLIFGIVLIHAQLGWWVGEHGTGGMEYSVALIFALLVISNTSKLK
jgi:putative oxidoreductase